MRSIPKANGHVPQCMFYVKGRSNVALRVRKREGAQDAQITKEADRSNKMLK